MYRSPSPSQRVSIQTPIPSRFFSLLLLLTTICSSSLGHVEAVDVDSSSSSSKNGNPYSSGCLHQKLQGVRPRVCNSQDFSTPSPQQCTPPPFEEYLEIRVATGNWDSNTALGWLTQIILSELLGVPTSVEAGGFGQSRDFYDAAGRIDYEKNVRSSVLATAVVNVTNGDCRQLIATNLDDESYAPCAHFIPEFWGGDAPKITKYVYDKVVEPPQGLGVLGQESWFVTKFTAEEEPSVVSYHGLQGNSNRPKLASMFKRPTTWKDYCREVSKDNCTTPDETARRSPSTQDNEGEVDLMFLQNEYTGHFRYTDKNNCTLHPTNCTGHIANYPCGWASKMESSLYHLEIGLDMKNGPGGSPNGYTTRQLKDMWHAANATRSHLMMMWWTPEPLFQQYVGSEAEMQPVLLKPFTLECDRARQDYLGESCDMNMTQRVGRPEGACGNPAEGLSKLIGGNLFDLITASNFPEAARSPAHDVLRRFRISPVQLGELFDLWESAPTPRDAVCTWAIENLDFLKAMLPFSYPRVPQQQQDVSVFGYAMIGLGSFATLVVLATGWMVHRRRSKPSIKFAQLDFLWIVLVGSFLVSVGAILTSLPASDGTCTASIWFVHIGYTLELMPLIIKVAAINKMMKSARRLRRITISRRNLYKIVAFVTLGMALFLALWTGLDAPQQSAEYYLTESTTDAGERIVGLVYFCSGQSDAWEYAAVGWNVVLLMCASVLAFQSRNTIETFNESRSLAFLIYSHFVFVVMRCSTFLLAGYLRGDMLDHLRSLIYALDQVGTCGIYFVPKLTASNDLLSGSSSGSSAIRRGSCIITGLNPTKPQGYLPHL